MTVRSSIDHARLLEEQLAQASPDLLRELLQTFINTLLSAEADAVCGAEYGTTSPERVNRRNGYRHRDFGHPRRQHRRRGPQAPSVVLLSRVAPGAPQARRTRTDVGGGDLLPARGLHPADGQAGAERWASPPCRGPRSPTWPRSSTPTWRSSVPAGSTTPVRSRSSPPTRWCSRSAKAAAWSGCTPWSPRG